MTRDQPSLFITLVLLFFTGSGTAASGDLKPYKGNLDDPHIELTDLQGKPHSLENYRGNVVLLQFWATYCTPCRKEMPTMNRLIDKMAGKPFKIVTVNMGEDRATIEQFLEEVPVNFPVLLDKDGATLGQWKVFAAPANFILDKNGNIRYTLFGAIEWDSEDMVEKLTELTTL